MVARDVTLDSLYQARRRLTDLIVEWAPEPTADPALRAAQKAQLRELILQRDHVNGAINAVIARAFQDVATPELLAATQELRAAADQLDAFGKSLDQVGQVLQLADGLLRVVSKVLALA